MSRGWKDRDSQAALEATRYENPIPSRLFIMETLEQNGAPMSHRALCGRWVLNQKNNRKP